MLRVVPFEKLLLTHRSIPAGPIPTAHDPNGVYPYESFCETSRRPELRRYRFVAIENDHVRAVTCPDLGGRLFSLIHKATDKDVLLSEPVVRTVRILPRFAYVSGGIEVSFPISHTPVQIETVDYRAEQIGDRVYVWCGEREIRFGMQWTVEYSLGRDDDFLTQRLRLHNPTSGSHPWMSWSNAAVPARPDTEFHFPSGSVLMHGDTVLEIDWDRDGPKTQADLNRMVGFFWKNPDASAFGVFTPSLGCGLYHVADPARVPGVKLWSYGIGSHEHWSNASTLSRAAYLEIQGGPIVDQSIKHELKPGGHLSTQEFWFPTSAARDIRRIALPKVELTPVEKIPLFSWPDRRRVRFWCRLENAFATQTIDEIPAPPTPVENNWAPSGMEQLSDALAWAINNATDDDEDSWRFQLGAWHAGRDEIEEALHHLTNSRDDRARALAGRIYRRCKQDAAAAVECFGRIQSETFALHPQVVVERDLALAALGSETLAKRRDWLDRTAALDDEWLIERRAALACDEGRYEDARRILIDARFQLIHQRYVRADLWKKIAAALGKPALEVPDSLGEDDLAQWGVYREYEEE